MSLKQAQTVRTLGNETKAKPAENPEAVALYRSAKEKELAYLHNHPSTNNLSLPDIFTFIHHAAIGIMGVVTNQGGVRLLQKTSKYDYNKAYKIFLEASDKFASGQLSHVKAVRWFLKHSREGGIFYGHS